MNRFIFFIPLLVILIFISTITTILLKKVNTETNTTQLNSMLVGKPFPKTKLSSLLSEEEFILDDVIGKPFAVNFFSSWCAPCQAESEILELLSKSIRIYGVSFKDKKLDTLNFINTFGNPFEKIGIDTYGMSAIDWGVYGVPETFLINSQGNVELRYAGPITNEVLKNLIQPKLNELGL